MNSGKGNSVIAHAGKVLVLAMANLAATARAADGGALDEVEVIGRALNLVGSATSASEGRISHAELALRPLLRTGEVLETVPGLVATQHSGSGKANQFFLRGFNLDHGTDFATFVDHMPVNMRSHGHGQGYTDLNFLIPELIEEISFKKGSYYADVGDFSGTGSATVATARHSEGRSIGLAYGQYDYQRMLLSGDADVASGDFIYGVELQGYNGAWDAINEDVDKTNVWLKQRWQRDNDSFDVMLMAYDNTWNSPDQIPARAVESGLISPYGSIDTTVGGSSSRYSVSANWQRQLDASTVVQVSAYVIDYNMDLYSNFSYFAGGPDGDQFRQIDDRRIYGGDASWRKQAMWAGHDVANTLGVQLRYDDIAQVGLQSTQQRRYLGDIRMDAVEEGSASVYWQNELHWTPKLRTVTGVRYDSYDFDVQALAAADPTTLTANSGATDDSIAKASFSLVYTLSDSIETYASIGRGFHSNDARGTTISLDPVSGTPVDPVDPLVPTLGSELGVRTFLTNRLNASVALWHLDIDSELLFVGDAGNTEDTGLGSERTGVEMTAYYQLNDYWTLDLEYSYTRSNFVDAPSGADEIPGSLTDVFSGGVNLRLEQGVNAYLRVRHFADYPLDGGQRADASTMLNLRLAWDLNANVNVTLDALNLADSEDHDVEYFYESQLAGETAAVEDKHFHVFEPRMVRAYLNYRF
jgi:hypothetical protein